MIYCDRSRERSRERSRSGIQLIEGDSLHRGELPLPTLTPDEQWEGTFTWTVPDDDAFGLHLAILRPTGFVCLEKVVTADGEITTAEH